MVSISSRGINWDLIRTTTKTEGTVTINSTRPWGVPWNKTQDEVIKTCLWPDLLHSLKNRTAPCNLDHVWHAPYWASADTSLLSTVNSQTPKQEGEKFIACNESVNWLVLNPGRRAPYAGVQLQTFASRSALSHLCCQLPISCGTRWLECISKTGWRRTQKVPDVWLPPS